MILFADRDELHREGASVFLHALVRVLPYVEGLSRSQEGGGREPAWVTAFLAELHAHLQRAQAALERGDDLEQVASNLAALVGPFLAAARDWEQQVSRLLWTLESAQREGNRYREAYAKLQESASAARLTELEAQVKQTHERVEELRKREERLRQALVAEQRGHQEDVGRLQRTVADLNRIVAAQQKQLNDLVNGPA